METRPHKIQRVSDLGFGGASQGSNPSQASSSQDAEPPLIGLDVWQQQRNAWVGSASTSPKAPSRPVISPDSTYDTLLLSSRPFAIRIPLAEMVDFLQEAWAEEGLYD